MKKLLFILLFPFFLSAQVEGAAAFALTSEAAVSGNSIEVLNPDVYTYKNSIDAGATSDTDPVTIWNDLSGNGNDFEDSFYTAPELNINGSDREVNAGNDANVTTGMVIADASVGDKIIGTDEFTVIYRIGASGEYHDGITFAKRAAPSGESNWHFTGESDGQQTVSIGGTGYGSNLGAVGDNSGMLVIAIITTTTVEVWIDSVEELTPQTLGSDGTSSATRAVGITLGLNAGFGVSGEGPLDLFAFISKAISTSEREAVEAEFQINALWWILFIAPSFYKRKLPA